MIPLARAAGSGEIPAAGRGNLVLLVDDDGDIREVTAAILETAGYSVQTACNGREALDLLRSIRPALILLDLHMPMLDGAGFREHQRSDPELVQIPTVVVSTAEIELLVDLGCAANLRKPVRKRDLLSVVEQYCDSSRVVADAAPDLRGGPRPARSRTT